ncbi:MAG: UDP-phosphate galactosephosphotransferase [Parcubacteria group bacterium Gr01-1014_18]|nr:MAG: UDP-phosphate galactosephosphotransferase [Parcubacteria group bacterium Greene0416_36]TSC81127.1 MAG: UDP-phosphate galactosephosphotransferase [Parcubacteria group bacterium Gr01-1014_18]TSC98456.1 MAG: UDP-phosphate galactosephosphotransferase [Parcubacteria group bacterium Greene1014_20]TSD07378.1 MAG: UDP-phosphate galactosephosphotransferase [Parcubacteria group bacterium Greene0714_2]
MSAYDGGKRLFDFLGAMVALVLLFPFFVLLVALIRLDSSGPSIIRQKRAGKEGKIFTLYKFRTMHESATLYARSPASLEDSRITCIGKYLRRWNLDELPQLWNILRGEMSLVGPRPEMPFVVEEYLPWQRNRLLVKPGLTGLWQISTSRQYPILDDIGYDLFYVQNRSFLLDMWILWKTIGVLWRGSFK